MKYNFEILTILIILLVPQVGISTLATYNIDIPNFPVEVRKLGEEIEIKMEAEGNPTSYQWEIYNPGCEIFSDGFDSGNTSKWQKLNSRKIRVKLNEIGYWMIIGKVEYAHEIEEGKLYSNEQVTVIRVMP